MEIGVNVFGNDAVSCLPIYKLSRQAFSEWMKEIGNFVARDEVRVYAENALNNIAGSVPLIPVHSNDFCMEIDNGDDLENARKKLGCK